MVRFALARGAASALYGRAQASNADVIAAASLAHAHEFVLDLIDRRDRRGYDAQGGKRRKLSGARE